MWVTWAIIHTSQRLGMLKTVWFKKDKCLDFHCAAESFLWTFSVYFLFYDCPPFLDWSNLFVGNLLFVMYLSLCVPLWLHHYVTLHLCCYPSSVLLIAVFFIIFYFLYFAPYTRWSGLVWPNESWWADAVLLVRLGCHNDIKHTWTHWWIHVVMKLRSS